MREVPKMVCYPQETGEKMRNLISQEVKCADCGAGLVIVELHMDLTNCLYAIECECILCGKESGIILSLEDFIDLNRNVL